ncbi:MAG: DNA-processing protein DprA [Actinomycetota bacterium]
MSRPDLSAELGALAALAGLPGMGPRRLRALVEGRAPTEAWAVASAGHPGRLRLALRTDEALTTLAAAWAGAARGLDPTAVHAAHDAAGVAVRPHPDVPVGEGAPPYPTCLVEDVEPPAVLLTLGSLDALEGPRVAIVGTRRCTGTGAGLARELGRELSASGVHIVSGLALGIDGAAHRGALDARAGHAEAAAPVAVVGSGVDVPYPSRHRELWRAVAADGVLLSEAPLGTHPAGWRFPARNRVIAALADVVVVVESHAVGGSLHTVQEAIRRGIDVMAVPGSVRSPAAAGVNQLLAEGCTPVRDAGDVLVALGLQRGRRRAAADPRPEPSAVEAAVLAAFDWEPATFEHLAVRTGLALPDLAVALEGLVASGWVRADGGWYERRATA